MPRFDDLIHQPVRLRIMAALAALPPDASLDFTALRDMLDVTDGNLSTHLSKLENAGYIQVEKTFVMRRPKTFVSITEAGRRAFEEHVAALQELLNLSSSSGKTG